MKDFFRKYGHVLLNVFLVICLGHFGVERAIGIWQTGEWDFADTVFAVHNIVFLSVILFRRQHQAIDRNLFHQGVSLAAFFSGITFVETPAPAFGLAWPAQAIICAAFLLATAALLNLGRSFGILIAVRNVKTTGLYGIVRHPMYLADILMRVGKVLNNPCPLNWAIFAVSSAAYVYRAVLEEQFLVQYDAYREYVKRVRYRFIPGIF